MHEGQLGLVAASWGAKASQLPILKNFVISLNVLYIRRI
jgi:hypothetical protein